MEFLYYKTCTHPIPGSYYFLGWREGVGGAGGAVFLSCICIKTVTYINLLSWNFPKQIRTAHDYKCNQEINSCFVKLFVKSKISSFISKQRSAPAVATTTNDIIRFPNSQYNSMFTVNKWLAERMCIKCGTHDQTNNTSQNCVSTEQGE